MICHLTFGYLISWWALVLLLCLSWCRLAIDTGSDVSGRPQPPRTLSWSIRQLQTGYSAELLAALDNKARSLVQELGAANAMAADRDKLEARIIARLEHSLAQRDATMVSHGLAYSPIIFTARRRHSVARRIFTIAFLSVSVTRRYCMKTNEHGMMWSSLSRSAMSQRFVYDDSYSH